jgi:ferredoxin-NADP reductase
MTERAYNAWQEAVIDAIVQQTPTVKSFVLRPRQWSTFLPGQHIDVRLTAPDGYEARRSYSLTSAPTGETFELAIERLEDGEVSPYFHDVALVGDTIEVSGPFTEHFVWRPLQDGVTLMIGGGSGMAPFMSMLRARAVTPGAPRTTFVYSARSWNDVIYRDELLQMEQLQRDLRVLFVLTRERPTSWARDSTRAPDFTNRIDAALIAQITAGMPTPNTTSFVCGNNGFVGTVAEALVAMGVAPDTIKTERYGE